MKEYETFFSRKKGMSLVELVIAMTIFAMMALSITAAVIQSQRISQNNIILNTAYTVAQGYLEQIRTIPLADVEAAIADPTGTALPTKSISVLVGTNVESDDPIFLDGPDRSLSGKTEGSNERQILIDLKEESDGTQRQVVMDTWFDIDISPINNQSYSHAVTVSFEVKLRGNSAKIISGELRGLRADINQGN